MALHTCNVKSGAVLEVAGGGNGKASFFLLGNAPTKVRGVHRS